MTARIARSLPASMAAVRSRISEDTPETPIRPDFLLRMVVISSMPMPSRFMMYCNAAASISPERVPMTMPSRGVMPIEVSTHLPSLTAESEEPLPRWQMMSLRPLPSAEPSICAARLETKRWEVPWKP